MKQTWAKRLLSLGLCAGMLSSSVLAVNLYHSDDDSKDKSNANYTWDASNNKLTISGDCSSEDFLFQAGVHTGIQVSTTGNYGVSSFGFQETDKPIQLTFHGTGTLTVDQNVAGNWKTGNMLTVDTGMTLNANGGVSFNDTVTVNGTLNAQNSGDVAVECGKMQIGAGKVSLSNSTGGLRLHGKSGVYDDMFEITDSNGSFSSTCTDYNLMLDGICTDSKWLKLPDTSFMSDYKVQDDSASSVVHFADQTPMPTSGSYGIGNAYTGAGGSRTLELKYRTPAPVSPSPDPSTDPGTGGGGTGGGGAGGGGTVPPPPPAPSIADNDRTYTYQVEIDKNIYNGTVKADVRHSEKDKTITLTVTPDDTFVLESLTVTDRQKKPVEVEQQENGTYTFKMPPRAVLVHADFVCAGGETCPSHAMTDVPLDAWFHETVDYALRHDVFHGTGETTFSPDAAMTQAMMAQVLYNLADTPAPTGEGFPGVAADAWYADAAAWALEQGIVAAQGDWVFDPEAPLTREQMAVMLYRYAGSPAVEEVELNFHDLKNIHPYALDAVTWAVEQELLYGNGYFMLAPLGHSNRAQVAALMMRYLRK